MSGNRIPPLVSGNLALSTTGSPSDGVQPSGEEPVHIVASMVAGLPVDSLVAKPVALPPPPPAPVPPAPASGIGVGLQSGLPSQSLATLRHHSIDRPVGPGASNRPEDVAWVKWRLSVQIDGTTGRPYLESPDLSSRTFDAATAAALAKFQRDHTGHRDGRVDPRGPTVEALARSPVQKLVGSVGKGGQNRPVDVARVQQALAALGYLVPGQYTLGTFNPNDAADATQAAINLFQRTFTHSTDGRIDPRGESQRMLRREVPALQLKDLRLRGAVGQGAGRGDASDVLAVQLRLVHHGALDFEAFVPGVYNEATQAAIVAFQARFMPAPDGRVDRSGRTSKLLAMDRAEMDIRHPRTGQDQGAAVDHRGDVVDTMADDEPEVANDDNEPVATPVTGFTLEAFPVGGGRFNIGYDRNWSNFDAPQHNSDYYLGAGRNHPSGHHGVDIFGPRGAPIVAPVTGRIVRIVRTNTGSGGRRVAIQRGNQTFYLAHLDTVAAGLRVGQEITAGAPIGTLGDTGSARGTAPHLHFSCYRGNRYYDSVDPFPYLRQVLP